MQDAQLFNLLVQLLVLAAAGFIGCYVAERVGTARIVGGLIAGLIVGPSLLGNLAPAAEQWLWRGAAEERAELAQIEADYASVIKASIASGVSEIHREILKEEYEPRIEQARVQIAVAEQRHRQGTRALVAIIIVAILFAAGRNGPFNHLTSTLPRAAPIALIATALPLSGAFAAFWLIGQGPPLPGSPDALVAGEQFEWPFALAWGLALAMMAVPVAPRLLEKLHTFTTVDNDDRLIPLLRAAAAINVAIGFVVVSVMLAAPTETFHDFSLWIPIPPLAVSLAVLIGGIGAVMAIAYFGLRLIRNDHNETPAWPVGLLLIAAMLPIVGAAYAGVPVALGALAAGLALGSLANTPALIRRGFAHLADAIALPILCTYIGTRIDIVPQFDWAWVLIAIVLFGDGKAIGVMLVGRYVCRLDWRASARMGTILAAGGALPLIVALMVYEAGVISAELFVALVIANAVTAALAAPTLRMITAYFAAGSKASEG